MVYDGISDHGTLEQRIMGSFMMCDQNHDHEIKRDEMTIVLRTANAMHNKRMPDDKFDHNMDVLMELVDADRVCICSYTFFIFIQTPFSSNPFSFPLL